MAYAPGISDKDDLGDIQKLKPGQLLDYVVQKHDAKVRGTHYDFRLGDKEKGMFSWAMPSGLPVKEKDKFFAARTHLHDHAYNTFEGTIPSGYGAGTVTTHESGTALVTHKDDNILSFSVADKKHPRRFTLVNPGGLGHGKVWMVIRSSTPDSTGAEKLHYKSIAVEDLEDKLKTLAPGWNVQAKLDGALDFININPRGKAEVLSHRTSKTTGKPVLQTERFFGQIPHNLPKQLRNTTLYAEVHGYKDGKILPVQELSGILNSSPAKSLRDQKEKGIDLKALLFDIKRKNGKEYDTSVPYVERRKALTEAIKYLPKGKFLLPRMYDDLDGARKLINDIKAGKEPSTVEGVVVHPHQGVPYKTKIRQESDVYITGSFPAAKGSKYDGIGAGGLTYSLTPQGPTVGRIGTGLSDDLRKAILDDPESFKGRIGRVASHGQFLGSKAHRVPALKGFIGIHEDY